LKVQAVVDHCYHMFSISMEQLAFSAEKATIKQNISSENNHFCPSIESHFKRSSSNQSNKWFMLFFEHCYSRTCQMRNNYDNNLATTYCYSIAWLYWFCIQRNL